MFQLQIPKRAAHCMKGGEPLMQGSDYYSSLMRKENEEVYQRLDYCPACWERASDPSFVKYPNSSWKSTVPFKKKTEPLTKSRDDRALHLLKEALSLPESSEALAEAFILTLYLARRRFIFLRQEMKREGKFPLCIYEVAETEEMLFVQKISISHLSIEKVQLELAKKFNAE